MTLDELSKRLAVQGIHLIRVESLLDEECLSFVGTMDEYVGAVKALGSKVVFVCVSGISEEDFNYATLGDSFSHHLSPAASWPFPTPGRDFQGDSPLDSDDVGEEEIDLCSINPELTKYRKKIGDAGRFNFLCADTQYKLIFSIVEKWMEEFEELRSNAETLLDEKRDARRAQMSEERSIAQAEVGAKKRAAKHKLGELVSDKKFVKLRTQREMLIYAKKKIPELATFDEADLKREIGNIKATIKVNELDV